MNKNGTKNAKDRDVWQKYKKDRPASESQEGPDSLTLAAYLDGRLSETEKTAVEAWLAESPTALDTLVAASGALSEPSSPAPDGLIERASALAGESQASGPRTAPWRTTFASAFAGPARYFWVASFAAIVLISGGAFELGQVAFVNTAALEQEFLSDTDWVVETVSIEIL